VRAGLIATLAVGAVGWSASVLAQPAPPTAPPPPPGSAGQPAAGTVVAPAPAPRSQPVPPPPPVSETAPPAERVGPVPTADETSAASDHDAVVGHLGVEARRFNPGPLPLTLQPGVGCPATGAGTPACEVTMGALAVRYWWTRNLAVNGGVAFAVGGGRDGGTSRDTYLGVGPLVGLSLLLGNWRHLAVSASPELGYVWFRPGGDGAGPNVNVFAIRAALEAEVHLGVVGVPALSIGLLAGMGFQFQGAGDARAWSVGVLGGDSVWGALSNLFVRYYL
jgi:hypothetical protein